MHFLIADDSDGKAMMLETIVKRWNSDAEVVRATSTEQAKELINAHQIAWAFIDYEMPSENGPAVIRYLAQRQPHCRIAMVSSSNAPEYRADAANAGAEAYICSSFASDEVERALMELLSEW